jgi:hypothetical protein
MKLIVVTPAGREKYLRLLSHYVLGSPDVVEWHLWENCRNESDRAYLHKLAASDPRCRLKQLPVADGSMAIIGDFLRFCDDPEALYLRLDDDIVFVEEGFFPRFVERALAERGEALWFSPIIINNAICNWLLKYFATVSIDGPLTAQAMCPFSWATADFPEAIHPVFIEAVRRGRLDSFRVPDQQIRLARFSINAFGFFGADKASLGERFCPPERNEEDWLSAVLPALTGRYGAIFGGLAVAHFSFHTQESRLLRSGLLEAYYELAGLPVPPYRRPRADLRDAFAKATGRHLSRPWRRAWPGPTYAISLDPPPEMNRGALGAPAE